MTIVNFTPWSALAGGLLIGLASAAVVALNGKIPGISGVCARVMLFVPRDTAWRVLFLLGLIAGGAAMLWIPSVAAFNSPRTMLQLAIAGLLVGVGTRIGGGCTSGHGVCGIGRGSLRSIAATMTFMACGMATVYVLHHVIGAGS